MIPQTTTNSSVIPSAAPDPYPDGPPDLTPEAAAEAVYESRRQLVNMGVPRSFFDILNRLPFRITPNHPAAKALVLALLEYEYKADKLIDPLANALNSWRKTLANNGWRDLVLPFAKQRMVDLFSEYHCSSGSKLPEVVEGMIVQGMPAMVAASRKGMKTTLAAWLAACIISGNPFLGRKVQKSGVLVLTLETPPDEFYHKVHAAILELGFDEAKAWELISARLFATDDTELVRTKEGREELGNFLWASGIKVAILDPLYLLVPRGLSTDLAENGRRLRKLCAPFRGWHQVATVFVHHALKSVEPGDALNLSDLTGAGVAEYVRSWCLLNRKAEYQGGGLHDLIMVTGSYRGAYMRQDVRIDERDGLKVTLTPPPTNGKPRGKDNRLASLRGA
jgi:hypothetical protein